MHIQRSLLTLLMSMLLVFVASTGCDIRDETPKTQLAQSVAPAPIPGSTWQPQSVAPSGLEFVDSFAQGREMATQMHKPMLLFFTATYCKYCHQMADTVFVDRQIAELGQRFVCIKVDADRERALCQAFGVGLYPTTLFVSSNGQLVGRLVGATDSAQVLRQMQTAMQYIARSQRDAGRAY